MIATAPFLFAGSAPGAAPTPPAPFTGLPQGYSAALYGRAYSFLGGVGFLGWSAARPGRTAVVGDVAADQCTHGHAGLIHFNSATTVIGPDGVTPVHPQTLPYLRSDTGCGIVNSSDRHLYAAVDNGVAQLDTKDGHLQRLFPGPTNTLGVDIDPVTRGVAYLDRSCDVGSTGCIVHELDPRTAKVTTLARLTAQQATYVDGIAFEPNGQYLLLNTRAPSNEVTVLDRTGKVVQQIGLAHEPDGIVFHANPDYALLNNTDGTLVALTFPAAAGAVDYTKAPVPTVFASGGSRGDLAAAGADGCLYLSQNQTGDSSVVRLCGPGTFVAEFTTNASPTIATQASPTVPAGGTVTDTATVAAGNNPTGTLTFTAYGPNDATCSAAPAFVSAPVSVNGNADYTSPPFVAPDAGTYRWTASYPGDLFNDPARTACNDANESVVVTPQVLTGRGFGLSASVTVPLLLNVTVAPTPDTGSISVTTAQTTTVACVPTLTGPVTVHGACAGSTTGLHPSRSNTTASVLDATISIPLLPTITLRAIQSQSQSLCQGSTGQTTIGFLQIGPIVVPVALQPAPNTGINLLGIKVILNEQIPGPGVLTVNGAHIVVPGIADVVLASSTSDIHNCP